MKDVVQRLMDRSDPESLEYYMEATVMDRRKKSSEFPPELLALCLPEALKAYDDQIDQEELDNEDPEVTKRRTLMERILAINTRDTPYNLRSTNQKGDQEVLETMEVQNTVEVEEDGQANVELEAEDQEMMELVAEDDVVVQVVAGDVSREVEVEKAMEVENPQNEDKEETERDKEAARRNKIMDYLSKPRGSTLRLRNRTIQGPKEEEGARLVAEEDVVMEDNSK